VPVGGLPLPTGFISTITSMELFMTFIQCTPTQPQLIAVSRLVKSPLNARRTEIKVGMEELKASLLAHGLMQNLVVIRTIAPERRDQFRAEFDRLGIPGSTDETRSEARPVERGSVGILFNLGGCQLGFC
jgi:hypothetical protein